MRRLVEPLHILLVLAFKMRRLIIVLVILLSLPSVCFAAFAIFQTYVGPSQILYNIVTDGGATCNDNHVVVTRNVTMATSPSPDNKNLNVSVNTFSVGDVGKFIRVPGASGGGGTLETTITAFVDAQNVTLANQAFTALTGVSTILTYGSNDAPAFLAFNTWALANQGANNQVVLTIPSNSTCWFGNAQFGGGVNTWTFGINNLIVNGNNSTLSSLDGAGFNVGGSNGICSKGIAEVTGCSARIQTVTAGASTITLTAASLSAGYISRFSATPGVSGNWIMVGGLNPQALWIAPFGQPPNLTYYEWRQVTNVNVGMGVITLDRPLTNSYLSTWPLFNEGNSNEPDAGGPATIYALTSGWNTVQEYRNLTISQTGQTKSVGRTITWKNTAFTGAEGGFASQNETWSLYNSSIANVEPDKLIGTMILDGATINVIGFQSNSTDRLIVRNSTFTNQLAGGGKVTEISDSTFAALYPSTSAYGSNQGTWSCTRCSVTTFHTTDSGIKFDATQMLPLSMSSGIIQWSNSQTEEQRWASTIGANYQFSVGGSFAGPINNFQVLGVTGDTWPAVDNQTQTTTISITSGTKLLNVPSAPFVSGDVGKTIIVNGAGSSGGQLKSYITAFTDTANVVLFTNASTTVSAASQTIQWGTSNVYVQTSMAGGFPPFTSASGSACCLLQANAGPQFTCDTCTGDAILEAMSVQAGATPGAPMGSYSSRNYAPTTGGSVGSLYAVGQLVSLTIDVTTASTAVTSTMDVTGSSHNETVKQSDWTPYDWVPRINLKQTGTRVITPSGTTCNGAPGPCSGDSCTLPSGGIGCYTLPEAVWFKNALAPFINGAFSGVNPVFSITIETDQGVVN